jgi:hypothetical protein
MSRRALFRCRAPALAGSKRACNDNKYANMVDARSWLLAPHGEQHGAGGCALDVTRERSASVVGGVFGIGVRELWQVDGLKESVGLHGASAGTHWETFAR